MAQVCGVLPDASVVLSSPAAPCYRSPEVKYFTSFYNTKCCPTASAFPKLGVRTRKLRSRRFMVSASGSSNNDGIPLAPLQLESPVGQLLAQILYTHPHLHLPTAEQQLENLQKQREDEDETAAPSSQDLLLYKRIAELKEKDRRKTLEEIVYCLIMQRFVENSISMIPKISSSSDPSGRVDFWPNQEQKLESVHSPEAFEMIMGHLSLILGERVVGPLDTLVQISKIKLGKLYAASIMYGYFLRRVDERYQLERSMNTLPEGFDDDEIRFEEPTLTSEKQLWDPESLIRIYPDDDGGGIVNSSNEEKPYKLRSYVMYLDAETLQRYATMRSKEAISLIEKQTQALFGSPNISVKDDGTLDTSNDEVVSVTFSGLTMLVLEAVAFGSFLWDAEGFVESKYPFINS